MAKNEPYSVPLFLLHYNYYRMGDFITVMMLYHSIVMLVITLKCPSYNQFL